MSAASPYNKQNDVAARAVAAVALGAIALIHVVDLPDTWTGSTLVGSEYVMLIIGAVVLAATMLIRGGVLGWTAAAALATSAMSAYTFSRTTGIPEDNGDIGNWRCPLGIAAMTVEAMLLVLAVGVLASFLAAQRIPARSDRMEAEAAADDTVRIEAVS
jgi:hypothetical protein